MSRLIYLIEDDVISATVAEFVLKRAFSQVQVQCFSNGQRAFDALTDVLRDGAHLPDLILLDLNMPVMDGWEFLDVFSHLSLHQEISVIVLTSSIHPEELAKLAHYSSVKSYFAKPLDSSTMARVQHLLPETAA